MSKCEYKTSSAGIRENRCRREVLAQCVTSCMILNSKLCSQVIKLPGM